MRQDLIVAGVGGQGILSIARVIGLAAIECGCHLRQSEVHGMAQRGGAVQTHLRLSDGPIFSDLIPMGRADMILSMEPMEALRYLPWLKADGWLIANRVPVANLSPYPAVGDLERDAAGVAQCFFFDAVELARAKGSPRSVNMAVLGAASPFLALPMEALERAIGTLFGPKGEGVVGANLGVFHEARILARKSADGAKYRS